MKEASTLFNRIEHTQRQILDVVQQVRRVNIRQLEGKASDEIREALSPLVQGLLKLTIHIFQDIDSLAEFRAPSQENTQQTKPTHLRFGLVIDKVVDHERAEINTALQDLSFVAILELNQWEQRLKQIQHGSGWLLIEEHDRALRRIIKALTAAELLLTNILGTPAQLNFTTELLTALHIRKTYAKLRAAVGSKAPSSGDILARLRSIGTRIAMLVGHDIYPSLRVKDRQQLRDLQQRLLSWLRGESDFQFVEASHLWQDIQSCVSLFAHISSRQELIEHDTAAVETLLNLLPENGDTSLLLDTRETLRSLSGLSEDVDNLLNTESTISQWRDCLLKLQSNFRTTPPQGATTEQRFI